MKDKVLDSHVGAALHELFREVFALHAVLSRVMDKVHEHTGLTTTQRKVMQVLDRTGAATVPDIASRLGVTRQSVQVVCNDLKFRGWVRFTENPRHKKSKLVALTESGYHVYLQSQEMEYQTIEKALPEIKIKEVIEVRERLERIRRELDQKTQGFI